MVGPDGPSLGGLAAVAQVIRTDPLAPGPVRAGDDVTLEAVEPAIAAALQRSPARCKVSGPPEPSRGASSTGAAATLPPDAMAAQHRLARDVGSAAAALVGFGAPVLDLRSRVRAQSLRDALAQAAPGPARPHARGALAAHVRHDPDHLPTAELLHI